MVSEINELQRCKAVIEDKLGWGPADSWQTVDFENLSELILKETGVSLSTSTLRRIWGRTEYNHLPSGTTLNTLARFAGASDWRAFVKQNKAITAEPDEQHLPAAAPQKTGRWKKLAWIASAVVAVILAGTFAFDKGEPQLEKSAYTFESRSVTRGIPNSVIFTYDASASPTDSVFIQQSWDDTRRVLVDKNLHKHTSVYYEPGSYKAKLVIGDQIVKEHKLLVGTDGWSALIDQPKMPVYLKNEEFLHADGIGTSTKSIEQKNIALQPEPPLIKYFNVGNFEPVALNDFSFSTEIKNEYNEGAAACQLSYISLLTDDAPIVIPLSAKGCVSDLYLMSLDDYVSGKKADLSALGVDFSDWVRVSCAVSGGRVRYAINNRPAFEFPIPNRPIRILGLAFGFRGTGSVRNVSLRSGSKLVFEAP
ncbi:hypothetical protein J2Y45_003310 [Dyadobacter sp. BE34]|uniref:PKD domain-containing protein n=1 Tax=Dyadobacter fermentans TaxID=94254 RepID=A0ABU1QY90_9BACT|nr:MULTISPECIES: hypothetical protein [Dyadobacter]MDR6806118.1 hypothetical protein [Dyadobacter fermentans]MDR7043859.1 hypothetical protein [Dyadobacter sp. BE242]MDR7198170.1 hypothetical protein [Dyadobacter sp. BE34]MDR7216133.1 hypothetical protein [Dyadobacter sp. BE31]MDR7264341.1 hypothetical protein [Dyadobacter sp. BE32]